MTSTPAKAPILIATLTLSLLVHGWILIALIQPSNLEQPSATERSDGIVELRDGAIHRARKHQGSASFSARASDIGGGSTGGADGVRDRYLGDLQNLILERRVYPARARQLRQTGKVLLQFQILKDGKIEDIEIVNASEHERLNTAAIELISGIREYRPFPESLSTSEKLTVTVPVTYDLY